MEIEKSTEIEMRASTPCAPSGLDGDSIASPVLQEICFEASPGQVIGIFGMTDAGKSTLLSLIPRFYDPQRGRILADGQDLRELDLDAKKPRPS